MLQKSLPKIIWNASAVVENVFPHWNYHWNISKGWNIVNKNNCSRNDEIAARRVFCRNACRKIIQNASEVVQNVSPNSDCLWHHTEWQYISSKNNGPINGEIVAGNVICRYACRNTIQNASEVVQNVSPNSDCLWHHPKWQYIGSKNNSPINGEIVAGNVICRYACWNTIQNVLAVFQNVSLHLDCLQHHTKWQYVGHKNNGSRNGEIAGGNVIWR